MNDSLTWTFNNAIDGTNYMCVFSDAAGSVTSLAAQVEIVLGPTNKAYTAWATTNLVVGTAGPVAAANLLYQWYFNSISNFATATKLVNSTHYAGVTANSLFITNLVQSDQGFYWTTVTNNTVANVRTVTPAAFLAISTPPYSFGNVADAGANINMSFTSANTFDTSGAFILQSAGVVTGPYTNNPAAITGTNPNFLVSVPKTGDQMFYRLMHK